jgi:hypothetical protein
MRHVAQHEASCQPSPATLFISLVIQFGRPCHSSGGWSLDSRRGTGLHTTAAQAAVPRCAGCIAIGRLTQFTRCEMFIEITQYYIVGS